MGSGKPKSVIKRVYVPTQVRDLPNGEKLKILGITRRLPVKNIANRKRCQVI